ncbi:MAG: hypothetical protein IJ447_01860 [Clostridia bacterium]|nr:hypothetical protein [Clostridia bacterium]
MKNTVISCIVAILCVVALCVTYAVCTPSTQPAEFADYLTEEEAADYIGVSDEVMVMIREKLGLFKGAFMTYTYTDASGKEVTDIVYNKAALDEAVEKMMSEHSGLNFKYLQDQAQ